MYKESLLPPYLTSDPNVEDVRKEGRSCT